MESGINPAELIFATGNSIKFAEARVVAEYHDADIKNNSVAP